METEFGRRTKKETETYSIYIYVCVWVFEFFLTSDYKQSIYTFLIHVFILHTNTHIHIYIYRKVCALSYKRVYGMQKGCCIVWVVQCSLWPCFDTFLSNPKLLFLLSLSLSLYSQSVSALSSVIAGAENAISVVSLKQKSLVLCARTKEEQKQWIKVRSFGPRACLCIIYIYIYIYICICMYVVYMYCCIYVCMYAFMHVWMHVWKWKGVFRRNMLFGSIGQ